MTENNQAKVSVWKKMRTQLHLILCALTLLHIIFYAVYWLANKNLFGSVNKFLGNITGFSLPYVNIILWLSGLLALWSFGRLFTLCHWKKRGSWKKSGMNLVYAIFALLFLLLFYFSFFLITKLDHSQLGILVRFLDLARVVTDGLILLAVAYFFFTLLRRLSKREKYTGKKGLAAAIPLAILFIALCLLPILFKPGWVYRDELPAKPGLFAHRGASMLAPENTLAAISLADQHGAMGFESDLRISRDGVPFLMHDETLLRTTDVSEVFPGRLNEPAEDFTMTDLKTLNAGTWFLLQDPYKTIHSGILTQAQLRVNMNQAIPTLEEALNLLKQTELNFMYDLRLPPTNHSYYDQVFDIVLNALETSELKERAWILLDEQQLETVKGEQPELTRVAGLDSEDLPSATELLNSGYQVVNVDTGITKKAIRTYQAADLRVNVYVVDQHWLFSQLWLDGVNSVTSNNIHQLGGLAKPMLSVPFWTYGVILAIVGLVLLFWIISPLLFAKKPAPPVAPEILFDSVTEVDLPAEPTLTAEPELPQPIVLETPPFSEIPPSDEVPVAMPLDEIPPQMADYPPDISEIPPEFRENLAGQLPNENGPIL